MQVHPTLSPEVVTLFDAIAFIASLSSLILAIVAIWIAKVFKEEGDRVNKHTLEVLIDIRSDAKSITQGVMGELRAYGESMRGTFSQNMSTKTKGTVTIPRDMEFRPPAALGSDVKPPPRT